MFTDQHESLGMSPLREGNIDMFGDVQRRATRLQEVKNPSHDGKISILNNAIQTITLVSGVIPSSTVQGVLSSVSEILGIVKDTMANQDDFKELAETCQMIGLVVWRSTSQTPEHELDDTVRRALTELKSSLDAIQDAARAKAKKNLASKIFHVTINQETIVKMKDELNRLLTLFNTEVNMSTNMKVDKTNMKLDTLLAEFRAAMSLFSQTDSGEPDVLPSQPVVFFGRDNLVQSITQSLLECHIVALIGPGGIGKSTIARAVLNDGSIASKFQGRRYFVRFDDMDARQVNLGTFLDRIARTLGLATSVNAHNLILRAISASDTLLVLDNAETFLHAPVDAGRIADVINDFGARLNVAILITTRTTALPLNLAWVRLEVPVLEESAACEAFQAYYPSIEKSILTKLLSSIEYHPLSINLLAQAALRNKWSPQQLVTAWDRQRATLLEAGDGKSQSLAITIETSLNSPSLAKFGDMIRHLLHLIAFLPQGISNTCLATISSVVSNIETCAGALCGQSIANQNGDFITLLAPIRLYILNHHARDTSMNPMLRGLRRYYAIILQKRQILLAENMNIEHVLNHWLQDTGGNSKTILDVLQTTGHFLYALYQCRPRPVSLYPAINALDVRKIHFTVSSIHMAVANFLKPRRLISSKSNCLLWISMLLNIDGQMEEAKNIHAQARALALEARDLNQVIWIDSWLAFCYLDQGNLRTAEELLATALNSCSGLSTLFRLHPTVKAKVKRDIITINMLKGRPGAIQSYLNFLSAYKQNLHQLDNTYTNIIAGYLELYNGHLDVAQCFFDKVQAMNDKRSFILLADLADQQGNYAESKALREQLLKLIKPDLTRFGIFTKGLLAAYLAKEGNVEHARELLLPLFKHTTQYNYWDILFLYYYAGMVKLAGNEFDEAEDYFHETIEISMSLRRLVERACSYRALGEIAMVKGDLLSAKEHFKTTTELCKIMDLPREHLYFDYAHFIPHKRFNGWNLYQEDHVMFSHVGDNAQA